MILLLLMTGCTSLQHDCRVKCDQCTGAELECGFDGKKSDGPGGLGP
jgi:hypothetical protein